MSPGEQDSRHAAKTHAAVTAPLCTVAGGTASTLGRLGLGIIEEDKHVRRSVYVTPLSLRCARLCNMHVGELSWHCISVLSNVYVPYMKMDITAAEDSGCIIQGAP